MPRVFFASPSIWQTKAHKVEVAAHEQHRSADLGFQTGPLGLIGLDTTSSYDSQGTASPDLRAVGGLKIQASCALGGCGFRHSRSVFALPLRR